MVAIPRDTAASRHGGKIVDHADPASFPSPTAGQVEGPLGQWPRHRRNRSSGPSDKAEEIAL